jgi:RNA polymerase primary sigma factor
MTPKTMKKLPAPPSRARAEAGRAAKARAEATSKARPAKRPAVVKATRSAAAREQPVHPPARAVARAVDRDPSQKQGTMGAAPEPLGVDFDSAESLELMADEAVGRIDLDASAVKIPLEPDADAVAGSVVELEAVADEDEDDEEEESSSERSDEPSNFLGLYFKEMARLAVLRPEEEFESARKIEELEIRLWTLMLGFAPLTDHLLGVVEHALENSLPEFKVLRRAAADFRKKPTRSLEEKLVQAGVKVAERIRAIDIDKQNLEIVVQEMKKIARGGVGVPLGDAKFPLTTKNKAFRQHLSQISTTYLAIQRAKNDFVKANLRLVVSIARRFNHGRMPLSDLIQEGNIGLIKAVERFDYRRGYRFSTYASWWIRHAISRALADKGRAVRLPVHMIDAYHRVARSKRELSSKLGRQPTTEELGEATGIAAAKIEKMRTFLLDQSFSLDRPISDEDGRKFIDFIADPNAETAPTDKLVEAAMNTEVRSLLEHLKPMEADILRQRFGLDTDKELTLKEIGEKYNLSRERIRQLQEQALQKMRRALQRKDMM